MKFEHERIKPKKEASFGKKPFECKDKNRKGSTKVNRIKPKVSMKNTKKVSVKDKEYLEWLQLQTYSCMVCGGFTGIEWHHVKLNSSDKKNHKRLIPLCGASCHRLGSELSAHGTPKKFREVYPVEVQNKLADSIYSDYLAQKS